jgi:hypothetical protein
MNKKQKPVVQCIQCGKSIDRRKDKYEIVTSPRTPHVKYACEECMKKPVLVYWKPVNFEQKRGLKHRAERERLNWKLFPKGTTVMDIHCGQRLILNLMKECKQ